MDHTGKQLLFYNADFLRVLKKLKKNVGHTTVSFET